MNNLLIVWNDSDNLGIGIVDEQHRGIVSAMNSLHYSIRKKRGAQALKSVYNTVRAYTEIHFATEEELLGLSGYPAYEAHRQLHAELIVKNLYIGSESLLMNDPVAFLDFLKDWWINHIRRQDRLYAEHVKNAFHLL